MTRQSTAIGVKKESIQVENCGNKKAAFVIYQQHPIFSKVAANNLFRPCTYFCMLLALVLLLVLDLMSIISCHEICQSPIMAPLQLSSGLFRVINWFTTNFQLLGLLFVSNTAAG
jgi:hypothetical protein